MSSRVIHEKVVAERIQRDIDVDGLAVDDASRELGNQPLRARQVLSRAIEIGQSRDEAGGVRTRAGQAEHDLLLAKLVPSIVRDRRAARVLREWDLWVVAVYAARRTREKEESLARGFGVRETRAKAVDQLPECRALRLEGLGRGPDPACTGTPEHHPRTISPSDLTRQGLSRAVGV